MRTQAARRGNRSGVEREKARKLLVWPGLPSCEEARTAQLAAQLRSLSLSQAASLSLAAQASQHVTSICRARKIEMAVSENACVSRETDLMACIKH